MKLALGSTGPAPQPVTLALPAAHRLPGSHLVSQWIHEFFGSKTAEDPAFMATHPLFCAFLGLEPGLNLARLGIEDKDV